MGNSYKVLKKQTFGKGRYSIVPIRMEDRYTIMTWRNQQIFHLRQHNVLSKEDQDAYFNTTVKNLFSQDRPDQILFSYLEDKECIGYGGLVHINWVDKNAEISFLAGTTIEGTAYERLMSVFLDLMGEVAHDLGLHKLFTYAFDVRPHIYPILEKNGFIKEAELKEHCFVNGGFKSVIIHARFNRAHKPKP